MGTGTSYEQRRKDSIHETNDFEEGEGTVRAKSLRLPFELPSSGVQRSSGGNAESLNQGYLQAVKFGQGYIQGHGTVAESAERTAEPDNLAEKDNREAQVLWRNEGDPKRVGAFRASVGELRKEIVLHRVAVPELLRPDDPGRPPENSRIFKRIFRCRLKFGYCFENSQNFILLMKD